jgi:GntR family transcriptional regulator, transcriptional repressor for pyruvate dehydrogenase complex
VPEGSGEGVLGALPAPVPRTHLSASVAERLAEAMQTGALEVGERLPGERELARRLRVSRIVVREALKALGERGLVEVRPGIGTFVVALDAAVATRPLSRFIRHRRVDSAHLFEVRRALEPAVAAYAAARAAGEPLEALRVNLQRTAGIVARLDGAPALVEGFAWADLEFHQLLAAATGNALFEMLLSPLLENLLDVRRAGTQLPGAARRAHDDHRRILERVIARDAAGARRAMRDHLIAVEGWITAAEAPGPAAVAAEDPLTAPTAEVAEGTRRRDA